MRTPRFDVLLEKWGEIEVGNYSPVYGLAIAAAGFPVYHLWKRLAKPGV